MLDVVDSPATTPVHDFYLRKLSQGHSPDSAARSTASHVVSGISSAMLKASDAADADSDGMSAGISLVFVRQLQQALAQIKSSPQPAGAIVADAATSLRTIERQLSKAGVPRQPMFAAAAALLDELAAFLHAVAG